MDGLLRKLATTEKKKRKKGKEKEKKDQKDQFKTDQWELFKMKNTEKDNSTSRMLAVEPHVFTT